MIRALFAFAFALIAGAASAQTFPGYGASGTAYMGNDNSGPPSFRPINLVPNGRLTLQSNTPIMTTTQASKTTIYYDCSNGGTVPVWNGTVDFMLAVTSCQISDVLAASGAGVTNAAGIFDEWAVNVAGVLTLCHATNGSGGGWASDTGGSNTARGTGYSQLNYTFRPYVTNQNALLNCYNGTNNLGSILASQATHLGTFATDASTAGSVTWQYGASGATPTAAIFNLWNRYQRVNNAYTLFGSTTASWTYATASWREANAFTTFAVTYTVGDVIDGIDVQYQALGSSSVITTTCIAGIGVDSIAAFSGAPGQIANTAANSSSANYIGMPGTGQHKIAGIEYASTTTCTWYGGGTSYQSALIFAGPSM